MSLILSGFEKRAVDAGKILDWAHMGLGAGGGALVGMGSGLIARGALEEKLKPEREKTTKDRLIAKAHWLGMLGGAAAGAGYGYVGSALNKLAELKSDVKLRDHQARAIEKLLQNDGSLLVAHATGSGKTLTGIAGFEKLKDTGKAKRAIVVVPAGLRENFVKNLKQYTNSSTSVYGPKNESKSKSIGDKSDAHYNIVSYELFREHGDQIMKDTGADTLIMDEIHRVRGTEGSTYNKIRELRPQFKNAITLTGSVVNNEPNDVVPLMDITYGPTGHKLVDKKFFDKLFVNKVMKTQGFWKPKTNVTKSLRNKAQLSKYLDGKIDFVSHKDLEKDMPARVLETKEIPMTKEQQTLYNFTLSSVDPITRWKIRNNLPVGQHEAAQAFGKLMQARQVSTDPSIMSEPLRTKNPIEYSPKVKAVVEDLEQHLEEKPEHKAVIFGNLIQGQVSPMERALQSKGISFSKFVGLGNEGVTAKTRPEALKEFQEGKKRVLLISGAGAEGLDLKNATMLQMLEGHYNPERIQQAEARIRRMGAFSNLKPEDRKVLVKRYVSVPQPSRIGKALKVLGIGGGDQGVDQWIYNIATRKDQLNDEFREVLQKKAMASTGMYGYMLGSAIGGLGGKILSKRRDADVEGAIKQKLLDRGHEDLISKKHYDKILAESKIDERMLDAGGGMSLALLGLPMLIAANPTLKQKTMSMIGRIGGTGPAASLIAGGALGLVSPPLSEITQTAVMKAVAKSSDKDLDTGITKYIDKLRAKAHRKYKSSKDYVHSYETKEELGIDPVSGM